jgi:hypothetical protein
MGKIYVTNYIGTETLTMIDADTVKGGYDHGVHAQA